MSEQKNIEPPKVLKFLNDYRKQLSSLKIKSFYANHLCKQHCLENKLEKDPSVCFSDCDGWLDKFFKVKKSRNPDKGQAILVSSEGIPEESRKEYENNCAIAKAEIKNYLKGLDDFIEEKVNEYK